MEARHIETAKESIGKLVEKYITTSAAGKSELSEVMQNLKHWKSTGGKRTDDSLLQDDADDYSDSDTDEDDSPASAAAPAADLTLGAISAFDQQLVTSTAATTKKGVTFAVNNSTQKLEERGLRRRRKKARVIFDMFDADGSATIDAGEMRELMKELCVPLTEEELGELMNVSILLDTNVHVSLHKVVA